jgi:hypothetical protein
MRTAPCGLQHNMKPLFIGMAAAEFLPADPAVWFDAAMAANLRFASHNGRIIYDPKQKAGSDASHDFLKGWLFGSIGGEQALAHFMDHKFRATGK